MATAYIGLGSNVGDRQANLRRAVAALSAAGVDVTGRSSVYETAPQGEVLDQPDFLNAVVRVDTELDAEPLLDLCKAIERELGREPGGVRHGPRPIDLDLLLLGECSVASARLRLPHPEITTRRFVLDPLLELEPGLVLPGGAVAAKASPAVADQRVARVSPL